MTHKLSKKQLRAIHAKGNYQSVGSYSEAEREGIKPVDSIISIGSPVVFEKNI